MQGAELKHHDDLICFPSELFANFLAPKGQYGGMNSYDRFWELVYGARRYLQLVLFFLLFLLVLSGVALVFGQSESASATMLLLDIILVLALGAVTLVMHWYSTKRHIQNRQ